MMNKNNNNSTTNTTTIAHLTDIHMNFPTHITIGKFIKACNDSIKEHDVDCFVLTGDISEAPHVVEHVRVLTDFIERPIFFVCGNHDFYDGSIEYVRASLKENFGDAYLTSNSLLEEEDPTTTAAISLSNDVALVGHDGFYDGIYADWHKSKILMDDYHVISELKPLYNLDLLAKIRELSKEGADHVYAMANKAIKSGGHKKIVIATHVPPFRENSTYMGKMSDDDWMPHFSSWHMGQAIEKLADENPRTEFLVLCGHSHGKAEFHPRSNVACFTGEAQYGQPKISRIHRL